MKLSRICLVPALALICTFATACADDIKIGVCDTLKAFRQSEEFKQFQEASKAQRIKYENDRKTKEDAINNKLTYLQTLKPEAPEYATKSQEARKDAIEYKNWKEYTEATISGNEKQQIKVIFDKVADATKEVATQKGLDLVISNKQPEIPPDVTNSNVPLDQLEAAIMQRSVLFVSPRLDITDDVLINMNKAFANKH